VDLREKALECGLLPRILERLSVMSGEKPRTFEEEEEEAGAGEEQANEDKGEAQKLDTKKNTERK